MSDNVPQTQGRGSSTVGCGVVRNPHRNPNWTAETAPRNGGRPKGSKDSYRTTLKRLLKTRAPAEAVAMVGARFPDLKPRDLRDLLASIHIIDATDTTAAMADRNTARKTLVGALEAPPASTPAVQVNIAAGVSLDSLTNTPVQELPQPETLALPEVEDE